ncbi:ATP-binding protein [Mobiluncus mulieris]|uniref:ATP-binding protein n=1 Tax=Mobiluncus mulieris TaxID=2052 RepID=A0A7Y0UV59_9ACTO|nr:ATP-binding protein [Mobiluncus mulieris]NMX04325.1 ATP-binding protein [Mobiluncus mulieris]
MQRFLMKKLVEWRDLPGRKPLVLNGARQVGKTWLLREFGRQHFENVAYISLDTNPGFAAQFEAGFDIDRLLLMIQAETGEVVTPGKTLIIFDEIQECPPALTSLKYFCENAPEHAIAAAGSLLGITFHKGSGFPVGKVDLLNLFPLSFREFLEATGNTTLREVIDAADWKLLSALSTKLQDLLKQYYFVGGMPECVASFAQSHDLSRVRQIQQAILFGYERDISKHLGAKAEPALAAWHSLPAHLGRENKKFIFGNVNEGARARDYRSGITWLIEAGIATMVPRVSKPGIPLRAYADDAAFKLFALDVGILGALADIDSAAIAAGHTLFTEFKGALTEQYVCQQLLSEGEFTPYYWSAPNSQAEIDFLVQAGENIYPLEVKAQENLRSKSLRAFFERYPETAPRRFSFSDFRDQDWMKNVPLYAVGNFEAWANTRRK